MTNGDGTDGRGALARMWRDVYQKAAGVADVRTTEQLKYHVYAYHQAAAGGGGGGGLVELGRAVATSGQHDLRVPASGALPTGYSGLQLLATGLNNSSTTNQNSDVYIYFNDELVAGSANPGGYGYTFLANTVGGVTLSVGQSGSTDSWNVGYAPAYNAADLTTSWGLSGTVPLHEGTALPKTGQFVCGGRRSNSNEPPTTRTLTGVYNTAAATGSVFGAITSVALRCGLNWRAGATFVVYGIKG